MAAAALRDVIERLGAHYGKLEAPPTSDPFRAAQPEIATLRRAQVVAGNLELEAQAAL